jgi:hypothetical protein
MADIFYIVLQQQYHQDGVYAAATLDQTDRNVLLQLSPHGVLGFLSVLDIPDHRRPRY